MRKIILYIIIILLLFYGYKEIKGIWQDNEESLDGTYDEVKDGIFSWYKSATNKSAELKEELNNKINSATTKYENLKEDYEKTTDKVNEKRDQLDQALKEIEEAKKALDTLLDKNPELADTPTADTENVPSEETQAANGNQQ